MKAAGEISEYEQAQMLKTTIEVCSIHSMSFIDI